MWIRSEHPGIRISFLFFFLIIIFYHSFIYFYLFYARLHYKGFHISLAVYTSEGISSMF